VSVAFNRYVLLHAHGRADTYDCQHSLHVKGTGPTARCMTEDDVIVIEDTPEPEEQRRPVRRGLRPALEERHPIRPEYSEYPIPFVRAHFEAPEYIGDPGLYIHIETPTVPKGLFQRPIVHHQDVILRRLPNPIARANYIFSKVCESGEVSAVGGGNISPAFLDQLDQPQVEPVLVKWEELVLVGDPLQGSLVEEVAALYGKSLPKEDWELYYFLRVWSRLQELFKLTEDGALPGFPLFQINKGTFEGGEEARQVCRWYREYQLYIELVQFQFRLYPGQSRAVFDRVPTWKTVEELGLSPMRLHLEYYQLHSGITRGLLGPVMGLQPLTWEEIQAMEEEWQGGQSRPAHREGRIRRVR
jgi:hypothetical protein